MSKFMGKVKGLFLETEDSIANVEDIESTLNAQSIELGLNMDLTSNVNDNVNIDTENLVTINSIYESNNLSDFESSIFKVEQIKNVLPENLPKESKKESVIGMMGVSKLTVDTCLIDAENRIGTLNGALCKFTEETVKIFDETENEIAELEDKVNSLRSMLTSRKKLQEDQAELIEKEIEKINSIVNFIK